MLISCPTLESVVTTHPQFNKYFPVAKLTHSAIYGRYVLPSLSPLVTSQDLLWRLFVEQAHFSLFKQHKINLDCPFYFKYPAEDN